jgi:hypothetical protein
MGNNCRALVLFGSVRFCFGKFRTMKNNGFCSVLFWRIENNRKQWRAISFL